MHVISMTLHEVNQVLQSTLLHAKLCTTQCTRFRNSAEIYIATNETCNTNSTGRPFICFVSKWNYLWYFKTKYSAKYINSFLNVSDRSAKYFELMK